MRDFSGCRAALGPDLHFDPPDPVYVARSGAASVVVGLRLQPLIEQLCASWGPGDDVAVWLHAEGACRLVAVLRTVPGGGPLVTWL